MATWGEFAEAAPELTDFGTERFRTAEVAYLATVRSDARPRVHPVTPIIGGGRLFVFMERTSPKGHDLRRNDRYALHSLVTDQHGTGGEFLVSGKASGGPRCSRPSPRRSTLQARGSLRALRAPDRARLIHR